MTASWAGLTHLLRHCLGIGSTFVAFREPGKEVEVIISALPEPISMSAEELERVADRFVVGPFLTGPGGFHVIAPGQYFRLHAGSPTPPLAAHTMSDHAIAERPAIALDRTAHANAIAEAQRAMASGPLRKVVLARTINLPFPREKVPELFTDALDKQHGAFLCLMHTPNWGTWLGASPERLVNVVGENLVIDSIAGTCPTSNAPSTVENWGAKEREEQALVTEQVLTVLAEEGFGPVHVQGPEVLRSAQVAHLHSRIQAPTGPGSVARLVARLHPTPAVCGTPTDLARDLIHRLEPMDRGLYAGFWGPWRMGGRTLLHVNIRCMRVFRSTVDLYVGGGITAASQPDLEWQETEDKALTWAMPLTSRAGRVS